LLLTLLLVPIMYVILAPEHFAGTHHIGDAAEAQGDDDVRPEGRGVVERPPEPVPSGVS